LSRQQRPNTKTDERILKQLGRDRGDEKGEENGGAKA